jgi:hypothetical protein
VKSNILIRFTGIEEIEWIQLAQLRAVVNTAMNWFPKMFKI